MGFILVKDGLHFVLLRFKIKTVLSSHDIWYFDGASLELLIGVLLMSYPVYRCMHIYAQVGEIPST